MARLTKKQVNTDELVEKYYEAKQKEKQFTEEAKKLNAELKLYMQNNSIEELQYQGISVKLQIEKRVSMDENHLLEILKGIDGAEDSIMLVETINEEVLESLIYNEKIDATLLAPAQRSTEIVKLNMRKKEVKNV